ncbi:MAG: hypothetical protein RM022_001525 [Nostoc sp. EfeVER01]|uniref:hypothetical protein n=1 Tax=unclassified Nostoc TaxID=2593658 RepID=UPI002AD2C9AC|nr:MULTISPECIES: hypothetical protein [unclassified Nostoc]MDZ7947601.1 hypothetical protein [Nostoc sp. EfeVER01]MDZ7990845.1 hypothetical protein [Nostoc sp. EspVER01]
MGYKLAIQAIIEANEDKREPTDMPNGVPLLAEDFWGFQNNEIYTFVGILHF